MPCEDVQREQLWKADESGGGGGGVCERRMSKAFEKYVI
jgi:hypothetical protein